MNNTIQSLLESANPWKSMQSDAARLANKWERTGLLDELPNETSKNNMAIILENQAKQLVVEVSQTGAGTSGATFTVGVGEQWVGIALPLVRKLFGQISAKEFVSVQPMNLPSGLVFFLDFQYGTTKNPFTAGAGSGFYNTESLYGNTNPGANNLPNGGLYGAGRFTYSTNNTTSLVSTSVTVATASWTDFNLDISFSASAAAGAYKVINVPLPAGTDWNGVRGFILTSGSFIGIADNLQPYTKVSGSISPAFNTANTASFIFTGSIVGQVATITPSISFQLQPTDQLRGDFEWNNTNLNLNNSSSTFQIPELNIKMKSEAIVAKTKKLKAVWTPEFSTDLNAYQSLDAEAELTNIMSEYISLEIDLEILDMLIQNASAGVEYWSALNNTALTVSGTNITSVNPGYYNSQGGWFQTIGTKISKLSNLVHQKTMRGGINFIVCSPQVSTILEAIPGYSGDNGIDADSMKYAFGVQKAGSINGKYKVYKNPYMTDNIVLLGYKGSQFLETGAVFAPYVPLIMTPLVYDPQTYTPGKGLLTRFAKKMVRPEFYAKLYVSNLNAL